MHVCGCPYAHAHVSPQNKKNDQLNLVDIQLYVMLFNCLHIFSWYVCLCQSHTQTEVIILLLLTYTESFKNF